MKLYTGNRDYPTDFPDQAESFPPKNLVASSRFTNLIFKVGLPDDSRIAPRLYGLYYDTYLEEYDRDRVGTTPFRYRFIYWTVEGTFTGPRSTLFRAYPGREKYPVSDDLSQFIQSPPGFIGYTLIKSLYKRQLNFSDLIDERWATEVWGTPNIQFLIGPNADQDHVTPSWFGWKASDDTNVPTDQGVPGKGSGYGPLYLPEGGTSKTPGDYFGPDPTRDPSDTPSEPEQEPFPDINWFNKPTRWNPPLIGTATGAYVTVNLSGNDIDETEPPSRQSILGSGGIGRRNSKKGYLRQYIISAEDFRVNTGEQETNVENPDWDNNDAMIDLEKGWVYGFRFHYNPEQVAFSTLPVDNIDPAFLVSGNEQAFPAFAQGASISFPLYLNRIEDLNLLRGVDIRVAADRFYGLYKGYSKKDNRLMTKGKDLNGVSVYAKEDIEGIKERGTGYDLEFLYRCAMGRPFPTALRGDTADLGIIIGLPMQLKLNEHLNYVGRLTGLSYNHVMFTQDMIPMLTVVNLQFTRIPDAQSFEGANE